MVRPLQKTLPQGRKHGVTIYLDSFTPGHMSKRTADIHSHKNLYSNAHRSTIHNSRTWRHPKCPLLKPGPLDGLRPSCCGMCGSCFYSNWEITWPDPAVIKDVAQRERGHAWYPRWVGAPTLKQSVVLVGRAGVRGGGLTGSGAGSLGNCLA